jgi:short-subunit dehydrogenase
MPFLTRNKQNSFALITAATGAIGNKLANSFANDKCNLVLVDQNEEKIQQLSKELRQKFDVEVIPMVKTLGVCSAALETYNDTKEMGITIDYLANIATYTPSISFLESNPETDQDLLQLNIISYVSFTKYFLRDMVKRNMGTVLHLPPEPDGTSISIYTPIKNFILSFSATIAQEINHTNVTVMSLLPESLHDYFIFDNNVYHSIHHTGTNVLPKPKYLS